MAIEYSGINYFPLLTGFFHSDKIELLTAMYGIKGPFAAVMLLCKIYTEGYYILWGKEQCMIFTRKLGPEYNNEMVDGIVKTLLEKDFFDKESYEKYGILTSAEIQKVWIEATSRRKRDLATLPYLLIECATDKNGCKKGNKTPENVDIMYTKTELKPENVDSMYAKNELKPENVDSMHAKNELKPENVDSMHTKTELNRENVDSMYTKTELKPENAYIFRQSKVKESKAKKRKELPPSNPPGGTEGKEDFFSLLPLPPEHALNEKTHNYYGLLENLKLHKVKETVEINAILKLSDYGRKGTMIWRLLAQQNWSKIEAPGKYIIKVLRNN